VREREAEAVSRKKTRKMQRLGEKKKGGPERETGVEINTISRKKDQTLGFRKRKSETRLRKRQTISNINQGGG